MRILHVNKFLYRRGGAEAYMLDLAELQCEAGHEVEFFGMAHPENLALPHASQFPSNVEFDPLPASAGARLRAAGRMVWSPSARQGMEAVLDAVRPDVVHLHNIYHHLSPSVLRPLARRRIPAVMTLHDYKLACPTYLFLDRGRICEACVGGRFHEAVRRRCKDGSLAASTMSAIELSLHTRTGAYDPVRLFVCPSRFMAEKMQAAGVYPDRLRVLPNFCALAGTPLRETAGSGIVYASRLSHEKGVDTLIEAVGRLDDATLHVAGDGPARAELEDLAGRVAPGRVWFHGRLPRHEVLELLRHSAVATAPSRCYENQPLAVLEALAVGVPVVGSALGGIAEIVRHGVNGMLVPPERPDLLATALAEVLADPDRSLAMGRAGHANVASRHDPRRHLEQLVELYAEAGAQWQGVA